MKIKRDVWVLPYLCVVVVSGKGILYQWFTLSLIYQRERERESYFVCVCVCFEYICWLQPLSVSLSLLFPSLSIPLLSRRFPPHWPSCLFSSIIFIYTNIIFLNYISLLHFFPFQSPQHKLQINIRW